jgi:hypothetical protein
VNGTARQQFPSTIKQSLNLSMEQSNAPITSGRFRVKNFIVKSINGKLTKE